MGPSLNIHTHRHGIQPACGSIWYQPQHQRMRCSRHAVQVIQRYPAPGLPLSLATRSDADAKPENKIESTWSTVPENQLWSCIIRLPFIMQIRHSRFPLLPVRTSRKSTSICVVDQIWDNIDRENNRTERHARKRPFRWGFLCQSTKSFVSGRMHEWKIL